MTWDKTHKVRVKGAQTIRVLGPSKIKDHESTKGATIKQPTNPQDQGEPYKVDKQFLYRTNKTSNLFSLSRYIASYIFIIII